MTQKRNIGIRIVSSGIAALLAACSTTGAAKIDKPIPKQKDSGFLKALAKSDFDYLADVEMRENTQRLQLLMTKLYKRNPHELAKSSTGSAEEMAKTVFENKQGWMFDGISRAQGTDAIQQAFRPDFPGDRVLSLIVGLQTMLIAAHGGRSEFYLTDNIDPQNIYNAARNVEIAVWRLSNKRDDKGQLYLLTNEMNDIDRNLSFERDFGEIIGSLDLFALSTSERSERGVVRVLQNLATALFLPFSY